MRASFSGTVWVVVAVVALSGLDAVPARADSIVVPNAFTATPGPTGQSTAIHHGQRTSQAVYASTQLGSVPVGSTITGLMYRLAPSQRTWPSPPSTRTWEVYDIQLSTSLHSPGALDHTFANNIGPDVVTVRSGPLTVPAGAFLGGRSLNPFNFEIVFTTPYVYQGGDLLITTRHMGNGVNEEYLDANFNGPLAQSIDARSFTATTKEGGTNNAPIVRLTFQSPQSTPEPSALILLVLGAVGLSGYARWRWKVEK
jgi:hypothetical protein